MANETTHTDIRAALIELVERSQAEEETFRAALNTSERALVGTAEQWAPKEVIAHLAYWKSRQAERVNAVAQNEELADGPDWGQLNTETWPDHARLTWDESVARSDQATRDLIAALERLPQEALGDLDNPESPANLLASTTIGNGLGHVAEHMADYYRSLGDKARASRIQQEAVQTIIALNLGPTEEGNARYNLACYYALHGEPADAIAELGQAFAKRPTLIPWAREDHDLDSLRANPAFQALVPTEGA
jgi:tetratricopeptide (TPR) repeat protein